MSDVTTEHPERLAFADLWRRARALVAGQHAVHAAGEAFLPRLADQDEATYQAYLKRTNLYNAAERTVGGLLGLVERKEPVIEPGALPDAVVDDVGVTGQNVTEFSVQALEETLVTGGGGALVDYPRDEGVISLAEAERRNRRPTWTFYSVENILNWRYRTVNNRALLVLLVLREQTDDEDGDEFGHESTKNYRVLRLRDGVYTQQLYSEEGPLGSEFIPRAGGQPWRELPFVFFRPRPGGTYLQKAPVQDLIDLNVAHYQVRADYRHGCHHVALPTPYVTGIRMDDLVGPEIAAKVREGDAGAMKQARSMFRWGPDSLWILASEGAAAGILEFTGAGLGELGNDQKRLEWQMATQGARMLAPEESQNPQTATGENIRSHSEHAVLVTVAKSNAAATRRLLEFTARWMGLAEESINFVHNTDFTPGDMDPNRMAGLFQMLQGGALSREMFHWNLQRGEVMPGDRTLEEELDAIETQEPEQDVIDDDAGTAADKVLTLVDDDAA